MLRNPVWSPASSRIASSHMRDFMTRIGIESDDYSVLHRFSVENPARFWGEVADYCGLQLSANAETVVEHYDRLPGASWFVDARLNYAENLLRGNPERLALISCNERGDREQLSLGELRSQVAAIAAALRDFGVSHGDRVAGILPNSPASVIAALATASLGAIWSSCSPDFGAASLLDRLQQIRPSVLFGVDGYSYGGKTFECMTTLKSLLAELDGVDNLILHRYSGVEKPAANLPDAHDFASLAAVHAEPEFTQVRFDDPLFIMFSSGTTGKPKCIVHGHGGTLIQHLKEHQLHTNIRPGDRVFYYTTTGWMMWNWLLSSLASGATLVLYDGAPLFPGPEVLWQLTEDENVSVFGTSARYLSALEKSGYRAIREQRLSHLDTILSTGSPLAPASFDFAYESIKSDMHLASISGGTDLISCFVLGNPMLPVYRGEIQCAGLGMDVRIFDEHGSELSGSKGELVCVAPFPSMPVGFWNDPDGSGYHNAYFARFPGVWHHGDYAEFTAHGGIIMHGRSDSTLNPGGIRIGTSEIYRILEKLDEVEDAIVIGQKFDGDTRIVLFVVTSDGAPVDDRLQQQIRTSLRRGASPHHVPAKIIGITDVPRTLNGKISERAVSDAVHGREIGNLSALANPESIAQFRGLPELAT